MGTHNKGLPCPICWHERVMRLCKHGMMPEVLHDKSFFPPPVMEWKPPYGGPKGQQVTRWDQGFWGCPECGTHLTDRDVTVLRDAIFKPFPWGMTEGDWQRLEAIRRTGQATALGDRLARAERKLT